MEKSKLRNMIYSIGTIFILAGGSACTKKNLDNQETTKSAEVVSNTQKQSVKNDSKVLSYQNKEYATCLKSYKRIRASEIKKELLKDSKKRSYIFWGRTTCPYCRAFLPKLTKYVKSHNIKIYYIDTQKTNADITLRKARKKYNISSVPSLIKIEKNKKTIHYDITNGSFKNFFK